MSDSVNHPKHYVSHPSGIEAIELCEHLDFCLGNAVKYLFRAGLKDPVLQDLQKAAWYLRRELSHGTPCWTRVQRAYEVIKAEPEGSVLRDVLQHLLLADMPRIDLALARVEREIERVQEGR
jgi:hypothetical protein